MTQIHTPLCGFLHEINTAAKGNLFLLAVTMTVALPDICVSLESADGRTSAERYKKWCTDNLGEKFRGIVTADDLYSMRCGVLHNGRFGDLKHSVGRIIFALPGGPTFVNCRANDAYFYSAVEFCGYFTEDVHKWMEKHANDSIVQANMPRLVQYRQGGLAPYVSAQVVLA